MKYSIYLIIDPKDNIPFYVGQTKDLPYRVLRHLDLTNHARKEKLARMKEILATGSNPIFKEVATTKTREKALQLETEWIKQLAEQGIYVMTGCLEHKRIIKECQKSSSLITPTPL